MRFVICLALVATFWRPTVRAEHSAQRPRSRNGDASRFDQVRKILLDQCSRCNNPDQKKGGLDLTRRAHLIQGGKNGPAIVPGNADLSLLLEKVEEGEMPPKRSLAAPLVEAIRTWIASGAAYANEPVT